MSKYIITITRQSTEEFTVEANSKDDAISLAMDKAYDTDWVSYDAEYNVLDVTKLNA